MIPKNRCRVIARPRDVKGYGCTYECYGDVFESEGIVEFSRKNVIERGLSNMGWGDALICVDFVRIVRRWVELKKNVYNELFEFIYLE